MESKDNNGNGGPGSTSNSPYPTTFVQAKTNNFKQVVQMLTGSSETAQQASLLISSSSSHQQQQPYPVPVKEGVFIPPIKTGPQKKQGFKLYERRNTLKNGLMISPLIPHPIGGRFSQRKREILSPSILDFPALALSPVTPLNADPFNRSPSSIGSSSSTVSSPSEQEERAIAEKKFYLHPSPRTNTPRGSEPQLLPLFPVTSSDE